MLASGVWRLCETPRRKSSLASSRLRRPRFWASTRAYSWALRMAPATSMANSSRRSWSARSQRRVAGRCPVTTPMVASPTPSAARTGTGSPGTSSSAGISRGSTSMTSQSIIPNTPRASWAARRAMTAGGSSRVIAWSTSRRRRSSALRRARSRARRFWLSARRLISSSPGSSRPAGSSPAETRSTERMSARRVPARFAARSAARATPEHDRDGDREQQRPRDCLVRLGVEAGDEQHGRPEARDGDHGRGDQPDRESRPESQPGAAVGRAAHWAGDSAETRR